MPYPRPGGKQPVHLTDVQRLRVTVHNVASISARSVVFVPVFVRVLLLEALGRLLRSLLSAPAVRVRLVGLEQLHLQQRGWK